jgi:hypothetical protein
LIVWTARHRYAVRRDDLTATRLVDGRSGLPVADERGHPYIGIELGPLLDPADQSTMLRRHALIVPLRRRLVALLADRVDSLPEHTSCIALPELLRTRLLQPWVIGALVVDDELIVQIDLRAVARSALSGRRGDEGRHTGAL